LKLAFRKIVVVFTLATAPVALAADRERVKEVAGEFICICGCNQLLTGCNHLNCPNRGPMLAEVESQIDQGLSTESIVKNFSEKYGLTVLSSPPVSGFSLTAWITPFAALLVGAMIAVYFVRRFRSRWATDAGSTNAVDTAKYQNRVEEELRKYTPED
jgi:cytochrome c-type biogenesis protein CcmH/NrfF